MGELDLTLGAVFIGCIVAAILYGISFMQCYTYFSRRPQDDPLIKSTIVFLWGCDTLHLAFIIHCLYTFSVTNYGNPLSLLFAPWTLLAQVIVTAVSDFLVRFVYLLRVWRFSGRNLFLSGMIGASALLVFVAGLVFSSRSLELKSMVAIGETISWLMYFSLASGVAADIILAATLCYLLQSSKTGTEADSLVHKIMIYGINNGIVTTLTYLCCLISYIAMPHNFVFMALYFSLSGVFFNSLLASLNARSSLREQTSSLAPISRFSATTRSNDAWSHYSAGLATPISPAVQPCGVEGSWGQPLPLAVSVETSTHRMVELGAVIEPKGLHTDTAMGREDYSVRVRGW